MFNPVGGARGDQETKEHRDQEFKRRLGNRIRQSCGETTYRWINTSLP